MVEEYDPDSRTISAYPIKDAMKSGNYWYEVILHGEREIVQRYNDRVYPCGDEQGWAIEFVTEVIREIRLTNDEVQQEMEPVLNMDGWFWVKKKSREWVGLTDDEIHEIYIFSGRTHHGFARAIEAKLKEKNRD